MTIDTGHSWRPSWEVQARNTGLTSTSSRTRLIEITLEPEHLQEALEHRQALADYVAFKMGYWGGRYFSTKERAAPEFNNWTTRELSPAPVTIMTIGGYYD